MNELFVCAKCQNVDLVSLVFPRTGLPPEPAMQLCTKCQTGHWHCHFTYASYDPEKDLVVNAPNGLGLG